MEEYEKVFNRIREENKQKEKDLKQNPLFSVVNMRITGQDKLFILNKFKEFAEIVANNTKFIKVSFGKQDIRGAYSVTPVEERGTTGHCKYFKTKQELIGFVEGYVLGYEKNFNL